MLVECPPVRLCADLALCACLCERARVLKPESCVTCCMSWTDWLSRHYMTDVPASLQSDAEGVQTLVGVGGIWPGTGSGNEPTESVHAAWQRQLEALGGKGHVTEALRTMENLYEKWCSYYDWGSVTALRTLPPQVDPSHMHGEVLARAGRSTGLKYAAAHTANPSLVLHNPCELRGSGYILAMPRSLEGTSPILLDAAAAQRSLDLLQAKPTEVKSLLEDAGILATTAARLTTATFRTSSTCGVKPDQACRICAPAAPSHSTLAASTWCSVRA